MLNADSLYETQTEMDGMWVVARPIKDGIWRRFKDAVEVIKGNADAVKFYKQ
jgi:hypothetical protein